ncbi:hypothetical protein BAU15_00320 [Enterococcus sp. JM4C]|uniref:hypothetical protein n=1 Tax=Candidatus Enterococcus huntleyi TaxID=1857217 RepID=UPI00137B4EFD|nr:hypothetical protein [Enterococcus sp. JM4C]KAF1299124.1 hypothetical protein BAU15_00320 [Enterococcus sp. JM4C]
MKKIGSLLLVVSILFTSGGMITYASEGYDSNAVTGFYGKYVAPNPDDKDPDNIVDQDPDDKNQGNDNGNGKDSGNDSGNGAGNDSGSGVGDGVGNGTGNGTDTGSKGRVDVPAGPIYAKPTYPVIPKAGDHSYGLYQMIGGLLFSICLWGVYWLSKRRVSHG